MTGAASDPPAWQPHIGKRPKARRELLAKRAKNPNDPLKLVIVRDMWLTGFDAPCMHTMYVDKPMKGHGLMQAIARVNRVFRDKPAGLVVDYIGIAQNLKSALGQYSPADQRADRHRRGRSRRVCSEKYEIVRAMFRPDTKGGSIIGRRLTADATPQARLAIMAGAIDWVLTLQQAATPPRRPPRKARSGRIAAMPMPCWRSPRLSRWRRRATQPSDIRDEVGFFQAIRAALVKSMPSDGEKSTGRTRACDPADRQPRRRLDRDRGHHEGGRAGKPGHLDPVGRVPRRSARDAKEESRDRGSAEAHQRRGSLAGQAQRHASPRPSPSGWRRRSPATTPTRSPPSQVLEELIQLAKDIRAARARGEESGPQRRRDRVLRRARRERERADRSWANPRLRVIAHELVTSHQEQCHRRLDAPGCARARTCGVHVKRILRKYGYPPDLQDAAVQNVLQQAEALSAEWA